MPFIRGRYHINAIAGEALEAAREAEAALLALQQISQNGDATNSDDDFGDDNRGNRASPQAKGPIQRVEIEASEMVPAHSGRAGRGYVARIHRAIVPAGDQDDDFGNRAAPPAAAFNASRRPGTDNFARVAAASPETHVFSGHRDLVSFLRDEFAKDRRS
jgi:hypothetical protein